MEDLSRYEDIDTLDYLPEDNSRSLINVPSSSSMGTSKSSLPIPESNISNQVRNWICIYPIYFDATKSKRPRRISKELASKEVTVEMIAQALNSLLIPYVIEVSHPLLFFIINVKKDKNYIYK
ncbi:hypothetical protein HMI54_002182 [Coelomomyces lativittatus]|nr:hypothetical protein HMI54_002182 [Coelomomyces lativittatus]